MLCNQCTSNLQTIQVGKTGKLLCFKYNFGVTLIGNYPNDKECDWTVSVPAGQKVKLVFQKFDTEASYDLVKVYDGGNDGSTLIKDISGSSAGATVTSTGNQLYVTFKSDNMQTGKGFKAVVSGER